MAVITWVGAASDAFNTAANWDTGAVPGSGDTVVFSGEPLNDCNWNLSTNGTVEKITVMADLAETALITISAGTLNLKSAYF